MRWLGSVAALAAFASDPPAGELPPVRERTPEEEAELDRMLDDILRDARAGRPVVLPNEGMLNPRQRRRVSTVCEKAAKAQAKRERRAAKRRPGGRNG